MPEKIVLTFFVVLVKYIDHFSLPFRKIQPDNISHKKEREDPETLAAATGGAMGKAAVKGKPQGHQLIPQGN